MNEILFVLAIAFLVCLSANRASANPPRLGLASWYGDELRGRLTANGEKFDPDALTCASWHYPFGTRLRVTHGSKSVVVRVNDRGPNRRFLRTIDLSKGAFKRLAPLDTGLIDVEVTIEK